MIEYGIDCSLNNCGIAKFENGVLQELRLLRNDVVKYPKKVLKSEILANKVQNIFNFMDENVLLCADVVYIERPSGSQDSNGMVNYAIEIAVFSYLKNKGLNVHLVSVSDAKTALTGNKNAEKEDMLNAAVYNYPGAPWLKDKKGNIFKYNHHLADAIGIYLAGSKNIKTYGK